MCKIFLSNRLKHDFLIYKRTICIHFQPIDPHSNSDPKKYTHPHTLIREEEQDLLLYYKVFHHINYCNWSSTNIVNFIIHLTKTHWGIGLWGRERGHIVLGVSGRAGWARERSAAQISSEADSSLTGIRGLPVNNRGSDLGHLAPWQCAHFSSLPLSLSLCGNIFL